MKIGLIDVDGHNMVYDKPNAPREIKDLQRWCNNRFIFRSCENFEDYKKENGDGVKYSLQQ